MQKGLVIVERSPLNPGTEVPRTFALESKTSPMRARVAESEECDDAEYSCNANSGYLNNTCYSQRQSGPG